MLSYTGLNRQLTQSIHEATPTTRSLVEL